MLRLNWRVAVTGLGLLLFPFVVKDPMLQNLAVLVLLSATAAAAWNLLSGFMQHVSLGHAVFFGIGGYTTGYLLTHHDISPWLGILLGSILAAIAALVVGYPLFRLRSHYFAIGTIAMQQVAFIAAVNTPILGQSVGIALPLKPESVIDLQFSASDPVGYHVVALALFALASLAIWSYMKGRAGVYTRAIRDDQDAASAMGVPVLRYQIYALVLSAVITAVAGGVYVMYALYVEPRWVLGIERSLAIALPAVLGGIATFWGPFIGAIVLVSVEQVTRVQFAGAGAGFDFIVAGLLIMVIVIWEPNGLVGLARRFGVTVSRAQRAAGGRRGSPSRRPLRP